MIPVGFHFIVELNECPSDLLDDPMFVSTTIREASERADLTLLGEVSHKFEPQGVTAIVLLAESHLSVHTWPENNYAAADLFTCGDRHKAEIACRHLVEAFCAKNHTLHALRRGSKDSGPVRVLTRDVLASTESTALQTATRR